jgi:triosephosphate isomerase
MRKLIIANWKTYLTTEETMCLVSKIKWYDNFIVAPSMLHLSLIRTQYKDSILAAQDISAFAKSYGASTGEISSEMLSNIGVYYAMIGHSERRGCGLDTDKSVALKVARCIQANIIPIVCVGETLQERKDGRHIEAIQAQLVNLNTMSCNKIIVAYEPIWSIGTGIVPSSDEILDMMTVIRSALKIAKEIILVYGGSVNVKNVSDIVCIPGVDGVLIGKASTDFDHLKSILDIIYKEY